MKLVGHRGAKDELPENTLLGISKAISNGVDAIEIDIHKSLDKKLMVIHDSTLERTTNGTGEIRLKNSEDLRLLDAGQGEKIPFLEEVLQLCVEKNIHLFIEVKAPNIVEELIHEIDSLNAYESCTVICFHHHFIKALKDVNSRINVGCLIVGTPIDPGTMVKNAGANLLAIAIDTVDKNLIDQCHGEGIEVAVWNANTKGQLDKMKMINADYVMTDRPIELVAFK